MAISQNKFITVSYCQHRIASLHDAKAKTIKIDVILRIYLETGKRGELHNSGAGLQEKKGTGSEDVLMKKEKRMLEIPDKLKKREEKVWYR